MKLNLERIVIDLDIALASWLPIHKRMEEKNATQFICKNYQTHVFCLNLQQNTDRMMKCAAYACFFSIVVVVVAAEKQQRNKQIELMKMNMYANEWSAHELSFAFSCGYAPITLVSFNSMKKKKKQRWCATRLNPCRDRIHTRASPPNIIPNVRAANNTANVWQIGQNACTIVIITIFDGRDAIAEKSPSRIVHYSRQNLTRPTTNGKCVTQRWCRNEYRIL